MDAESCKTIKKEWPRVSCLFFKVPNEYNAPLNWGRQNYINLLTLRSELMYNLVSVSALHFFNRFGYEGGGGGVCTEEKRARMNQKYHWEGRKGAIRGSKYVSQEATET